MVKLDTFEILTDRPEGIYIAGEQLSGKLVIKVKERFKINAVKMVLCGFAKVHWQEQHQSGNSKRRHTVHYTATEEYLNHCFDVLTKQGNGDLYMEVGDYSYPFSIKLPPTLPTSFEHVNGRVRYSLNGTIDIPWAFDKHVQRSITVISHVDLNLNPLLREPYNASQTKVLCCWCCKSDPIVAALSVPKGGYVPGEQIIFNAIIDNKSKSNMKSVSIRLLQYITLYARGTSRTWSRLVTEVQAPMIVKAVSKEEWKNGVIVVPPVCASSNNTCRIINIAYLLVLHVNPSGASLSFNVEVPLVIGTIPISQNNSAATKLPSSYQNYQRSQLEGTINKELDIQAKGDVINMDKNWAPSYPYYKNLNVVS